MKDERFPSIPQALLLVLGLFLVEYLVGAGLYDSRRVLGLSDPQLEVFVTLLANAAVFVVLMAAKDLGFRDLLHPSPHSIASTTWLVVPPVAMLVPLLLLVAGSIHQVLVKLMPFSRWEQQMFDHMGQGGLAGVLAACVLAPVLEEMLFRGIILRAFLRQYPRWHAIFASALIFGVAHLNIYQFVGATMSGVLLGWLYERTHSLIPCIALHAMYNSSIRLLQSLPATGGDESFGDSAGEWGIAAGLALVGATVLLRLLQPVRQADASQEPS